jgi:hypothetical protein
VNKTLISRIKIFSIINSERTSYVFDLVFKQLLGIEYELVSSKDDPHLSYSSSRINPDSVFIPFASVLLSISDYETMDLHYENSGEDTILFPKSLETPENWKFDMFAAIFYLVSRYEEYKGFKPDAHQRFPPEKSVLYKTKSLEYPLVNIWVKKLKLELLAKWPELQFNEPSFQFISTIDVDSTFQYREKGLIWSLIGFIKDMLKGNFNEIFDRIKTLLNMVPDGFNVFDKLEVLHKKYSTQVIYFWLLGNYSKFDKNIHWKNKKQANVIKMLIKSNEIGIHPSYKSNSNEDLLSIEMSRLKHITNQLITKSRQHFLVHQFPYTYKKLIKEGVTEDYTMGYTSQYGFRAGIASPFYFFDLSTDRITDLKLYPFCSMDITPLHYAKLNKEQAIEKNRELLNRVKSVNGLFISLWHNESLSGKLRWKGGWEKVYEQLLIDANQLMDKPKENY